MTIRDDIDQYITYFKAQNQEIAMVARPTFKKVLYLIEIDTLYTLPIHELKKG
jgi:hypothetical protein